MTHRSPHRSPHRFRKLARVGIATLACAAAWSAQAEGLYVGGNLSAPRFSDSINGIDGRGNGVGGKLYGGYTLAPNLAVEAGVAALGHIDEASGHVRGRGAFVDAVGTLPLANPWALLGRVGVAHVNLDTSQGDDSGTALKVGAGAQYTISANTALRAEWERYRVHAFGDKSDIDQFSVGVRYAF